MTSEYLQVRCIKLYGEETGKKLFFAMRRVANLDFCVATGWNEREVSIARGCESRGKIFELTEDYEAIILPGFETTPVSLRDLSRNDITTYLPEQGYKSDQKHCSFDNRN